jgi:hypothetical protein
VLRERVERTCGPVRAEGAAAPWLVSEGGAMKLVTAVSDSTSSQKRREMHPLLAREG